MLQKVVSNLNIFYFEGDERSRCSVNFTWIGEGGSVSSGYQALMPMRTCSQNSGTQSNCPSELVDNITLDPIHCLGPTVTSLNLEVLVDGGFAALNQAFNEYIPTNYSMWEAPSAFTFEDLGQASLLMSVLWNASAVSFAHGCCGAQVWHLLQDGVGAGVGDHGGPHGVRNRRGVGDPDRLCQLLPAEPDGGGAVPCIFGVHGRGRQAVCTSEAECGRRRGRNCR